MAFRPTTTSLRDSVQSSLVQAGCRHREVPQAYLHNNNSEPSH